jgi:hypothetical protein
LQSPILHSKQNEVCGPHDLKQHKIYINKQDL